MRTLFTRLSVLVALLALAVGVNGVFAQDAMEEKVVCDADLILSLYVAESHFDYAAVQGAVMASGMDSGFDLSKFDYGQVAPLFGGMMSMMDDNMSMGMLDETEMATMVGMMSISMEDMTNQMMTAMDDNAMMENMTTLPFGDIAGEPAECTALRANLRQFYVALAAQDAMSMMMEATPAQ
jgi:hypothetical protein